jgi:uncharacterized membrane protein (TIGR02234 family)
MKNSWLKGRGFAVGCLLVGGALALFGTAQPWWRALGEGEALRLTGTQATGGLSQALAIVALAGTLLILVLRTQGRRVLGVVLLLVGMGVALVGGLWMQPRLEAIRDQLGHVGMLDNLRLTATAWPWMSVLAGGLIAVGGAMAMITAGSWPSADRFQSGSGKVQVSTSDDPAELWKAMDAGVDPTARDERAVGESNDHDTPALLDPKMRDRRAGDTMDGTEQAQQLP